MAKERIITVRLDPDLAEGVDRVQAQDGAPISEQVRRALRRWLEEKGAINKTGRKAAVTARRP